MRDAFERHSIATEMAGFQSGYMHAAIHTIITISNGAATPLTSDTQHTTSATTPSHPVVPVLLPTGWLLGIQRAKGLRPGFVDKAEPEGRFPHSSFPP